MTKEQFREKFSELRNDVNNWLDEHAEKVLRSGVIDLESEDDPQSYRLARIVLTACLHEAAFAFKPLTADDQKTVKIIQSMV